MMSLLRKLGQTILDGISKSIKTIPIVMLVFLGIMIYSFSICIALYLPTKVLSVLCAAVGCSLGAVIVSFVIPKITTLKIDQERSRIEDEARKRAEREKLLEDNAKLHIDNVNLMYELKRYQNMRMELNSFQAVTKLTLFEFEWVVTDVKHNIIGKIERNQWWNPVRPEATEYLGICQYAFIAKMGIDLEKLRFCDFTDGRLEISGLTPEYQGKDKDRFDWIIREIRVKRDKQGLLGEDFQVLTKCDLLDAEKEKQQKEVIDRVNNGVEFQRFADTIITGAKDKLQMIFASLGKELIFSIPPRAEGVPLMEYLEAHNRRVTWRINEIQTKLKAIGTYMN